MITKIAHTALKVRDIEKSCKFYTEVMGFKEVFKLYNDKGEVGAHYMHVADGQFLELFPGGKGENSFEPEAVGHAHICYEVDNIEDAARMIAEKGILIDTPINRGKSGCLQLWIKDPDGNRIEIMELPDDSLQAKAKRELGVSKT